MKKGNTGTIITASMLEGLGIQNMDDWYGFQENNPEHQLSSIAKDILSVRQRHQ
jgi:NaMN:DMB phosphoribosyltransferase